MLARRKIFQAKHPACQRYPPHYRSHCCLAPGNHGTLTTDFWGLSGCHVVGVLVLFQNPLSLADSSTRLHLRHHLFEKYEVGGDGKSFPSPVCLLYRSAYLQARCFLDLVHKRLQAPVRISFQCLDLDIRDGRQ